VFSSALQANPSDPASRTVLILAGGFSDPSTWVPGRLKSTFRGASTFATALSFPKTALPRAASPMQTPSCKKDPQLVTDRNRGGRARLEVLAPTVMLGLHQAIRRRGGFRGGTTAAGSRPHLARLGGQAQTGNHIVTLGAPDSEHVRSRAEIDSFSVSNGRAGWSELRGRLSDGRARAHHATGECELSFGKHSIGTQGPAEEHHLG